MAMKIEELKNELDRMGVDYGKETNYLKLNAIYLRKIKEEKTEMAVVSIKEPAIIKKSVIEAPESSPQAKLSPVLEKLRRLKDRVRSGS